MSPPNAHGREELFELATAALGGAGSRAGHRQPDGEGHEPDGGDRWPGAVGRQPESGSRRPATGDRSPESGSRRPATGNRSPESGSRRPATGNPRPEIGDRIPSFRIWVPGRIEFLGKHTDYAGGRSLVCAVDRGFAMVVSPRADDRLIVRDALSRECVESRLAPAAPRPEIPWGIYPATVARRVALNFPGAAGADVAFASDLPSAAGMSSSSALVVGVFLALSAANDLPAHAAYRRAITSPEDLAGYLGTVENGQDFRDLPGERGVGTFGGSEDHTAMLCGRDGALVQYSYAPVRFEREVPLPPGHVFAVASSGVVARKTGAARDRYNALSRRATALLDLWRATTGREDPTLAAAMESSPDAPDILRDAIARQAAASAGVVFGMDDLSPAGGDSPAALSARLEHFLLESLTLVPAAGDALLRGDAAALGEVVRRSQVAAERLLGNQVPETEHLARAAARLGAVAASAFGAGFGGSVWALVPGERAADFVQQWRSDYVAAFPRRATAARFFLTRAAGPATVERAGTAGAGPG